MRVFSDKMFARLNLVVVLLFTVSLLVVGCEKEKKVFVSVLPKVLLTEFQFRGFVTDQEEELVSEIHNFTRTVTRRDTVNGREIFAYASNSVESLFYTDEEGTVWEHGKNDIGGRLLKYGFAYKRPVFTKGWQILLRMDDGVGTEWETAIDTTFDAITLSGEGHKIRYMKHGKARYDGWTETFLPEPYANIPVLDAHWYDLKTVFLNETTGDTLFSSAGSAHQYFAPDLGAVKYITDFVKTEIGGEATSLQGTWELMKKQIPGE